MPVTTLDTPNPSLPRDIVCPPRGTDVTSSSRVHGWQMECVQEGTRYLQSQPGYDDIDSSIRIISNADQEMSKHLSQVRINLIKRDVSEIVATLSNVRMLGELKCDNRDFDSQLSALNKMHRAWYLNTFVDRAFKQALQYAAVGAKGYVGLDYEPSFWTKRRGDITVPVYGPRQILPVQLGPHHDLQRAYAVTIKTQMGYMEALAKWPTCAALFTYSTDRPSWFRRAAQRLKFHSPALNASERDKHREDDTSFPLVDIFTTYVNDMSVNPYTQPVSMGPVGTKWNYTVPFVGQDIPSGIRDGQGRELTRKATAADCLLYPLRRRIISTTLGTIDDDTSPWWHARVPVVPFGLDDWPWDFLGYSLIRDVKPAQDALTSILRAMNDSVNAKLDPTMQYPDNMSKSLIERINIRKGGAGGNVRIPAMTGEQVKPLVPPEYYNLPAWMMEFVKSLSEAIPNLLGTRDIKALANARQVPAGDTLEKLMELAGPRTADKSRSMEQSIREFTDMWKAMAFEFYDARRIVQVLGEDGVTEHMFDYDPGNMIPSHTPDEYELISQHKMQPGDESRVGLVERARAHIDTFYAHVKPYSLHQMTQMSQRLLLMQLFIRGFPIDPWTIAESFDISNFGRPPAEYEDTVFGKWIGWEKIKAEMAQAMGGGQAGPRGRKPSGQTAPVAGQKSDGRPVVRESPR